MKLVKAIKQNKDLDLHGMKPEAIIELLGMDTICEDYLDDLQYYIDRAWFELKALAYED
ncbi:MAG: hypothetical protein J6S85_10865 [Methanobrevibacter sp.]|nr:hypothetical protein [Methanobrevibacter sp.]